MSNFKHFQNQSISYFSSLKSNKTEAFKALTLVIFTIYLTLKFIGAYDSTSGYDIRGEFCGYLLQLSFFAFLYINFKTKEVDNFQSLRCLSFLQLLLAITNFLIIKSLSTFFILKIVILFGAMLLFLVIIRNIAK